MKNIRTILLIGLIFLLTASGADAIGVGVVPSRITIDDALKGGTFDRQLGIANPGDESCNYEITVTGDIEGWVGFYALDGRTPVDMLEVSGKETKKIIARFSIPEDMPNGNYRGTIYVKTVPKDAAAETGMGAHAVVRAPCEVMLAVTGTQILTGFVESITADDTEINYPVRMKVKFKNTGNVLAYPAISVDISKDGSFVDHITSDKTAVMYDKVTRTIPVEWNTTGQIPGDYLLNVTVSLGGDVLTMKDIPVELLPTGTLTRKGDLTGISTGDEPAVGRFIKILATFKNTGAIDTNAKFAGELYLDGNRADIINSDELLVPVGETTNLTAYVKIETPGNYVIKGHVLYDGKTTDTEELSLDTSKTKTGLLGFGTGIVIAAVIAIAIVLAIVLVWKRKYKK